MEPELRHLLLSAKDEIKSLRRQNELLGAKMEMVELFACVLHTAPAKYCPPQSIDVAWEIEQALQERPSGERERA